MTVTVVVALYCTSIFRVIISHPLNRTCGLDGSTASEVPVGVARLGRYPWMGMLYYPMNYGIAGPSITVVLVSAQTCLASAYEVDKLPKKNFRARARVTLGQPCGQNEIRVRDYAYHPEYKRDNSYSALAMIQLETDHISQDLRPICPPPEVYTTDPKFYAMSLTAGCSSSRLKVYRMEYVDLEECQKFYRRTDLDVNSMWARHTVCARSTSTPRDCLWRSGSLLALKQNGRWRLLGFSIFGPGCGAPARFFDYSKYFKWVRRSMSTIGWPAITRLANNHLVMRRSLSNIQRFGPCDPEETKFLLYSERQRFQGGVYTLKFNLSLYANVEYSCILFSANEYVDNDPFPFNLLDTMKTYNARSNIQVPPMIRVRRWCAGPPTMCYGFQYLDIHFAVVIDYKRSLFLNVTVYGQEAKIISPTKAMQYQNKMKPGMLPVINTTQEIDNSFRNFCHVTPWHYGYFGSQIYKGFSCPVLG